MFGTSFKGQKYNSTKKSLLKKGELFVDPEFPPTHKSLFFSRIDKDIEWKRPKELCKVPRLVVDGATCDDLNEGELGNMWFVSACSCLAIEPKLFAKVIPNQKEQEWGVENPYAGIFHFQFWRFGEWVDVVVDDMLPTKNGKLVFCHSKSRNEFWSALLEKAYAKLYGDYETLMTGHAAEALVDFSGGVAEKLDLIDYHLDDPDVADSLFWELHSASENKAMIICNISCSREEIGSDADEGLIKGHGYGVTNVRDIRVNKGMKAAVGMDRLRLLRLSNPWGTQEWTGKWSDDSPEWKSLSLTDREEMGITFQQEGEFWMAYEDFLKYFTKLDICHFVNTSFFSLKKTWNETMMHGEWTVGARGTKRDRAGGCEDFPDKFLYNPQYVFDITPASGDTFMVSLEQHDTGGGKMTGEDHKQIGFHIMRVEENRKYRVHIAGDKMAVSAYTRARSIFQRLTLNKGRYVIIPSTHEPGIAARFLLRMYTSAGAAARELELDCPKKGTCAKGYALVTRVSLKSAEGLQSLKDPNVLPNPMVSVKCEGETVKSGFCREAANPEWIFNLLFYRKNPGHPIIIEVMNHKTLIDEFLGQGEIHDISYDNRTTLTIDLYGKGKKEKDVLKPGKVVVEIESSDDLTTF